MEACKKLFASVAMYRARRILHIY